MRKKNNFRRRISLKCTQCFGYVSFRVISASHLPPAIEPTTTKTKTAVAVNQWTFGMRLFFFVMTIVDDDKIGDSLRRHFFVGFNHTETITKYLNLNKIASLRYTWAMFFLLLSCWHYAFNGELVLSQPNSYCVKHQIAVKLAILNISKWNTYWLSFCLTAILRTSASCSSSSVATVVVTVAVAFGLAVDGDDSSHFPDFFVIFSMAE